MDDYHGKKLFKIFNSFVFAGLLLILGEGCFAFEFNEALPELNFNTPEVKTFENYFNLAEAETASARIIKAAASGEADGYDFNELAAKNINNLISAYYVSKDENFKDKLYFAVLPAVWNNAYFEDTSYYLKILRLYRPEFEACLGKNKRCNYKKAGFALQILFNPSDKSGRDCGQIAQILSDKSVSEKNRIEFMQYAAPIMAVRGCRAGFEKVLSSLGKEGSVKASYCAFDPFAIVHAFDDGYSWIKETCTHSEGFLSGVCARFKARSKPFLQYKEAKVPAVIKKLTNAKKAYSVCLAGKSSVPYLHASALRIYASLFINSNNWEKGVSFLINESSSYDVVISAARELALASLAERTPAKFGGKAPLKAYFAARLNNAYFYLDNAEDVDASVKAEFKNDIGFAYAKITGYKGASPIKLKSAEGFEYQIRYSGNEKDIEGFWSSLFNFSKRPAESLMNINIIALISKGGIKQASKLGSLGSVLSKGAGYIKSVPAIVSRTQAQYRAIKYLAAKNSTPVLSYAYKNMVYRKAANTAARSQMTMVEGKAAGKFFSSSHYIPAVHGNISRVGSDVKKASSLGIKALGRGGSVPSFVPERNFGDIAAYTEDLLRGANLKSMTSKYKGGRSFVKAAPKAAPASGIESAENVLPRSYLYSSQARYLPFVQDYAYANDYLLRNRIYNFARGKGFVFFNAETGNILPSALRFHREGEFVSKGLLGVSYIPEGGAVYSASESANTAAALASSSPLRPALPFARGYLPSFPTAEKLASFAAPAFLRPSLQYISFNPSSGINFSLPLKPFERTLPSFIFANRALDKINKAVFRIDTPSGGHATAFYVTHRGANFMLTAGHAAGMQGDYFLSNVYGKSGYASAVYKSGPLGEDLAILVPSADLVAGIEPLKLALKEPALAEGALAAGFPGNSGFKLSPQELMGNYRAMFLTPRQAASVNINEKTGYYMANPALGKGFSGGPLISENGVIGVASRSDLTKYTYYVRLPVIRNFIGNAFKDLFVSPYFNQEAFLSANPGLALRYSNIIGKYGGLMGRGAGFNGYGPLEHSAGPGAEISLTLSEAMQITETPKLSYETKAFGFSLLKMFGFTPRKALSTMYRLGAAPQYAVMPKLNGERYLIENFDNYAVSKAAAESVPFPYFYGRHNVYRGMALNNGGINKIFDKGLLLEDTRIASNTVATIYMRTAQRAIFFSKEPSEAFFYAKLNLSEKRGVPVVVMKRSKNIFGADFGGNGIPFTRDIPFEDIKIVSALLNIDGKPVWGRLIKENGLIYFMPYK